MSRSQEFSQFSDILTEEETRDILQDMNQVQFQQLLSGNPFNLEEGPEGSPYILEDYKEFTVVANGDQFPIGEQLTPLSASSVLSNEEYSGPHDFEVCILPNNKSKSPWVFSSSLNKVFMDMEQPFPVDFKIKNRPNKLLFIRVTPQYSSTQYAQEPVYRCIQHSHPRDPTNKEIIDHIRPHVIRCNNTGCHYIGTQEENQRLSLVFPFSFPQTGSESVREMFFFVCKSSCPAPGMNRRGIEVIFTLENVAGEVLGRKCLQVRVCACPKRDKEKEEKEKMNNAIPKGKKRKLDTNPSYGKVLHNPDSDTKEYNVNLKIVGKQNLLKVLNYAEDIVAAQCHHHQHNGTGGDGSFKKNLLEIQALKANLA